MTESPADEVDLSLVIPVFDEEGSLRDLLDEVEPVLAAIAARHEIVFVDDGSRDGSRAILEEFAQTRPRVVGIPVNHRPRRHGTSKFGVWNRLFRGLRDLRGMRWMQDRWIWYEVTRVR